MPHTARLHLILPPPLPDRLGQQLWNEGLFLLSARGDDLRLCGSACAQKPSVALCAQLRELLWASTPQELEQQRPPDGEHEPPLTCLMAMLHSLGSLEDVCGGGQKGTPKSSMSTGFMIYYFMRGRALTGMGEEDWAALTEMILTHAVARAAFVLGLHWLGPDILHRPRDGTKASLSMQKLASYVAHMYEAATPYDSPPLPTSGALYGQG